MRNSIIKDSFIYLFISLLLSYKNSLELTIPLFLAVEGWRREAGSTTFINEVLHVFIITCSYDQMYWSLNVLGMVEGGRWVWLGLWSLVNLKCPHLLQAILAHTGGVVYSRGIL